MSNFGMFTEGAQKALILAQEEAKRLGHNYIGTEHILLGLLREEEGAAAILLKSANVLIEQVREAVAELVGRGEEGTTIEIVGYTPRTKKVLEQSVVEARNLGNQYVGTEHILLALLREIDSVAAKILLAMSVDFGKTRQEIVQNTKSEQTSQTMNKKGNSTTPALDQYGRDLTQAAKNGELDPVIGRHTEIERIIQILCRRTKNNPVLIGEPGVGKSAVVEGLAQQIASGNIPELLKNKKVIIIDLPGMLAGAKFRGEFEERFKNVLSEIKKSGNVILFIDEMHTIIGAGAAEGAIDAANILKPMLARGELQTIGATTLDEYRKHVEKDPALERRFQPVTICEPSEEETIAILKGLRDRYEAHHKVRITDEAIKAAVMLSSRYITDRFLPDKAIDLVDEAASKARIKSFTAPPDMKEIEVKLESLQKEKEEAVQNQNFERAAKIRDDEKKLREEMDKIRTEWQDKKSEITEQIGEEDIAHIVASWTNIPVRRLTESESEQLMHMEEILHQRVVGQEEAVNAVAKAIRRARSGLKDPKRPMGSFLFLGPTGVGKTELCKALGEAMFGDENAVIRLDMSEYMERHTVSRLVGAPPGYVGYEEGGQLTEQARKKPYSVLLLDEIEKAHPDVFNVLLQIMEDGRLTDGKGRTVDFRNVILIMTSNAGAHVIRKQKSMGFGDANESKEFSYEKMKQDVLHEVKNIFRPEFINRVDEIIVFHELDKREIVQIAGLMLKSVAKRLAEKDIYIEATDTAKAMLAESGFDPIYGARPLRRAVQRMVEDTLSEEILAGKIHMGDHVVIDVIEGKLTIKKEK